MREVEFRVKTGTGSSFNRHFGLGKCDMPGKREDDGGMSKSLYLVSGRRPTFSLGCRPPTGSRNDSPEVVTRMRFAAAATMSSGRIGLPGTVDGGVETSGRRRGRAGTAATATGPRPTVLRPTPNTLSVEELYYCNDSVPVDSSNWLWAYEISSFFDLKPRPFHRSGSTLAHL